MESGDQVSEQARLITRLRAEIHCLKEERDRAQRESLVAIMGLVAAAGGKISVLPRDLIGLPEFTLHRYSRPENGAEVYELRRGLVMFDRKKIWIKLVGGPFDGDTAPPTERDEIEVVRLLSSTLSGFRDKAPPTQAPPYRHRYRRNMQRPWEFEYRTDSN